MSTRNRAVNSQVNVRSVARNRVRLDPGRAYAWALLAALSVLGASARAEASGGWERTHPVALGARIVGRVGQYQLAGVGGQLRIRPVDWIAIDLFADQTFGAAGGFRHDHEIGGTLQFPSLLRGERWSAYPFLGACAMLVVLHPDPVGQAVALTDVRFGVHGGAGFEYFVHPRVSLQTHLEAIAYVGHDVRGYRWGGEVTQELYPFVVGQLSVGANYWF